MDRSSSLSLRVWLVVLVTVFWVGSARSAEAEEPPAPDLDEVVQRAFDLLARGIPEDLAKLVPTHTDYEALIVKSMEGLSGDARDEATAKLEAAGGAAARARELRQKALARVAEARARSAEAFDWEQAKLIGRDRSRARAPASGGLQIFEVRFLVGVNDAIHGFGAKEGYVMPGKLAFARGLRYEGRLGLARGDRGDLDLVRAQLLDARAAEEQLQTELDRLENEMAMRDEEVAQMRTARAAEREHADALQRALRDEMEKLHRDSLERMNTMHEEAVKEMTALHEKLRGLAKERAEAQSEAARLQTDAAALGKQRDELLTRLRTLAPCIVAGLKHVSARVRSVAEPAAYELALEDAAPHFAAAVKDTTRSMDDRVRAATFFARLDDKEALVGSVRLLVAAGVAKGDDEDRVDARIDRLWKALSKVGLTKEAIWDLLEPK